MSDSPENSEEKNRKYEVYLAERRLLIDAEHEQSRLFDKTIVTLGAAGLALSLGFAKNFVYGQPLNWDWLLFAGWGLLILSLLSTLASFQTSVYSLRRALALRENPGLRGNRCQTITAFLNWTSLSAFILGATSLTAFAAKNV